ncbi:MAG: SDR family NAD(P)-dependent oxidoreductase [Pseudomonadota bacterium]|nr:SDR family NAD(P)-dependent oxidoreductase [Pseudomonadota bacterium]
MTAACRKPDKADELNALAADSGGRITVIGMEVRDEASVHAAAAHVGSLDLVVCNAGTLNARGGLTDPGHTPENIAESLMTNIAGVFFTARHFAGHLKGSAAPRIAVISSQMGSSERAGATAPIYRATKAAATKAAAAEQNRSGAVAEDHCPQACRVASAEEEGNRPRRRRSGRPRRRRPHRGYFRPEPRNR